MLRTTDMFLKVRKQIVGIDAAIHTPFGEKSLVYADWTASGRSYHPIKDLMLHKFEPFMANTHTRSNATGSFMTEAYYEAQHVLKRRVNASSSDVLISTGTGATGAINKLQRLLGLRGPEQQQKQISLSEEERPVVFVSHMEHHSNHTSWLECVADVVVIPPDEEGKVCPHQLQLQLDRFEKRSFKIGSFTACSNVTGVQTPYHTLAKVMHQNGGVCFVDFSASAPYININMHPEDPLQSLDAIFFSPHKFLGGPGTNGVLVFHSTLYKNEIPDHPGGGTVIWTNPWGEKRYYNDIETREDGGTPGILQMIQMGLVLSLKEQMNPIYIHEREQVLLERLWKGLKEVEGLTILAAHLQERLPIVSFYLKNVHYDLVVKLLNDRFGIQARGGCSCAGTYGHHLLGIDRAHSKSITDLLDAGKYNAKPGWIRLSLHPTTTEGEVDMIIEAVQMIAFYAAEWGRDYIFLPSQNEFQHKLHNAEKERNVVQGLFAQQLM